VRKNQKILGKIKKFFVIVKMQERLCWSIFENFAVRIGVDKQ
jgi:hypothetical protein